MIQTYMRSLITNSQSLNIVDYNACGWVSHKMKGKKVAIFHHYDENESERKKLKNSIIFKRFLKFASDSDVVVVVAKYWENYLNQLGIKQTKVIYNSFDINNFSHSQNSIEQFKQKYNLTKPIIYLGKNSYNKTFKIYDELKPLEKEYHIITTGRKREFEGPLFFNLKYSDYLKLLSLTELTIVCTPFNEGWNRIAHESILSGTKVLGTDSGGLGELLRLTGQKILKKDESIFDATELVLKSNENIRMDNLLKLNMTYFCSEWNSVIKDLK